MGAGEEYIAFPVYGAHEPLLRRDLLRRHIHARIRGDYGVAVRIEYHDPYQVIPGAYYRLQPGRYLLRAELRCDPGQIAGIVGYIDDVGDIVAEVVVHLRDYLRGRFSGILRHGPCEEAVHDDARDEQRCRYYESHGSCHQRPYRNRPSPHARCWLLYCEGESPTFFLNVNEK